MPFMLHCLSYILHSFPGSDQIVNCMIINCMCVMHTDYAWSPTSSTNETFQNPTYDSAVPASLSTAKAGEYLLLRMFS